MLWFDLCLVAASLIGRVNHQDSYRLRWSSVCLGRLRDSQRLSRAGRPPGSRSIHSPFTQTSRFYFPRTYSLYLRHFAVTILYQAALREPPFRVEGSGLEPANFHLDWPHTALQHRATLCSAAICVELKLLGLMVGARPTLRSAAVAS